MKMTRFLHIALFMIGIMQLVSCSNPDKVLPKKDGKWDLTQTYGSDTEVGTMDFSKDGEVTVTIDGSTEQYEWDYSEDKKTMTLSQAGSSFARIFEVKETKSKYEKWVLNHSGSLETWELER